MVKDWFTVPVWIQIFVEGKEERREEVQRRRREGEWAGKSQIAAGGLSRVWRSEITLFKTPSGTVFSHPGTPVNRKPIPKGRTSER